MEIKLQATNLDYVEEISGGDNEFKKELIQIFLKQIPEFTGNMKNFLAAENWPDLAKEAHTAKSSVLIFMMEETGKMLKQIQLNAEAKEIVPIPGMLQQVQTDLENASRELATILRGL